MYQGRADNREEPEGKNKREEQSGGEGRRGGQKLTARHLLPRNGIDTQGKQTERVWRRQGSQKKAKGSKSPVIPRSSQVNVLQLEQQDIWR